MRFLFDFLIKIGFVDIVTDIIIGVFYGFGLFFIFQGLMRLYFVRHPESENDPMGALAKANNDTELTDKGNEQLQAIAIYFHGKSITKIYTSHLKRCKCVTEELANTHECEIIENEALSERNRGELGTHEWREVYEKMRGMDIDTRYHFKPEQGESWFEMEQRLVTMLQEIVGDAQEDDEIIIVTHMGSLRGLLPALFQVPKENHESFSVDLASITTIDYKNGEFLLKDFNNTEHLQK